MNLRNQRRIAAEVLKCGENRVWIDPDEIEEVEKAVTRQDIRNLVKKGIISAKKKKGVSRARARILHEQRKKGRRRGHGSRKGAAYARRPKKVRWILTIRPIRRYLRQLRDDGIIAPAVYRRYYARAKGGEFKSKHHLKTHLIMEGVIKE
ncbi:MAG: 50S ribosomal protein L19e [Thermoplasmata archaeon]|nr:MAG: 50S ribosomal protein L19e [Thermoplasmata archaeon]HHH83919.1 50S ribosomal protein L19e [Thermoplasmatales archaeon]MCD6146869.1 50S ribosomal protein L19e [Thermoplasmata archaeon]RLF44188.1 MAG: 50S ribosomal protein L19e [Thermoplasmata archaeon]RLF49775.1 MAG: 50S ribosomal protein L19e [Thermoplasmata archaeon]